MEIDTIISNIKEMLVERGDNIDEFEEHERDIEREDFNNDSRILEFHTSNTTIIFCMTKKLRKNILDELKSYSDNITKFITKYNNKKNIVLEASGKITKGNILEVAKTGVNLISSGWITHSSPSLDIGLDFS